MRSSLHFDCTDDGSFAPAERWPEVRARLLKDCEDADLLPRRARSAERERKRVLAEE